jgi:hypothetical protein
VEKDERRDEEREAAKRSILERLRDHRDARGVPLSPTADAGGGEDGVESGGASLIEEFARAGGS